ncbi:MAG: CoA-binding protein [Spirochaetes bacterium]|nr:CoA-binding protein [Spirochaetota bacterium]
MFDFFFNPDGVAILGATTSPLKGGYHILKNLLSGYRGRIYPVNPNYKEILGLPCYPDLESIPGNFDLVIYFIPSRQLPDTIAKCASKGVRGIIIESGGFTEAGPEGAAVQKEALKRAVAAGIRLWGPNCMGFVDAHGPHVFSFLHSAVWPDILRKGDVGFIVQSGMMSAGFLLSALQEGIMGVSKACSIGNKCDINENDILEYFIQDDTTRVIACYLESLVEGRKFLNIARKTDKPIIVLSGGRSEHGARAALSHTASLSGDYVVTRGAFRQAGVVEARDPSELTDMARAFSKIGSCVPNGGPAILTFSGGAGTITTDILDDYGIPPASLSAETLAAVGEVFPAWIKPAHPIDLWVAIEQKGYKEVYRRAIESVMNDPAVDSVLYQSYVSLEIDREFFTWVAEMMKSHGKPVILWVEGRKDLSERIRDMAEEAGIPAFRDLTRCVSILNGLRSHFRKKRGAAC